MTIEEFIEALDFNENDYFYHVTSKGNGKKIIEEGLYVDGNNILGADNILETTTLPLTIDIASDTSKLIEFLVEELGCQGIRDTSELIVLGAPKTCMKQIVSEFDSFKDGTYYEGIIHNEYVMGYFDKESLEFTPNEEFCFGNDDSYGTMSF